MDKLTLEEQHRIFLNAEAVIAEAGSNTINSWLMPFIKCGIELLPEDSLHPWGMCISSAINKYKFIRVDGKTVQNSQRRFDGKVGEKALSHDKDYVIDINDLSIAIDLLETVI